MVKSFTISWDKYARAYKVSVPNYEGGEVVKADDYAALEARLAAIHELLSFYVGSEINDTDGGRDYVEMNATDLHRAVELTKASP